MGSHKFNPKMLDKLNNPERLNRLDLDKVIERLHIKNGDVLVDLGAGTGLFAGAFLDRLPSSICHALDIEPAFIEWMRENHPHAKSGRLRPALMSEAQIPLPNDSVQLLFMISLHHELDDAEGLLSECRRVLLPGGGLLVVDWDPARAVEGSGPPRDHMLPPEVASQQMKNAGFVAITPLEASSRYYCFSARVPT